MFTICLYFILSGVFGNAQITQQKSDQMRQSIPDQGIHEMVLKLKNDYSLSYTVSVPSLKPEQQVPLILALHYGGEVTPYYGRGYLEMLVDPALKKLGAIIIAPDCPGKNWTDPKSEKAILELLDFVKNSWPVDSTRLVVTGFSMGGAGAWFLAEKYPKLFSAAIPVAAYLEGVTGVNIPVYVIHSKKDEIIMFDRTEQAVNNIIDRSDDVTFIVIEDFSHYQTARYVRPLKKTVKWLRKIWIENP